MTTTPRSRLLGFLIAGLCLLGVDGVVARIASASPFTSGPKITLDRDKVSIGDSVRVTITGFDTSYVVISVCGNEARRGSADCNMVQSDGRPLSQDGTPTIGVMPISTPPAPCPCVIRVASRMNDQVAISAITIVGHPVAEVVDAVDAPPGVSVSIRAVAAPNGVTGWVKSSLGGGAAYDVTIAVKNQSTTPISRLAVTASAGRGGNSDIAVPDFGDPGTILPGQTWQQTVTATVSAPSLGTVNWRASVAGAGMGAQATTSTQNVPWLLLALVAFLVIDLALLLVRFRIRRRMQLGEGADADEVRPDDDQIIDVGSREANDDRQLVDA